MEANQAPVIVPYEGSRHPRDRAEPTILATQGGRYRFNAGHVPAGEEGRKDFGGPMVPGPWAYAFGLCSVICSDPDQGTSGHVRRAKAEGRWVEVEDGDHVSVGGHTYRIRYKGRGQWIALDPV